MPEIYEMELPKEQQDVLDALRDKVSCGITIQGNRITMRFNHAGRLCHIHTVITEISTPSDSDFRRWQDKEMDKLFEKYPDLSGELFYVEHGEHLK